MHYFIVIFLCTIIGCKYLENHGEEIGATIKEVAPIARIAPAPAGEVLYYILTGVGSIIAAYGAHHGVKKLSSK